MSDIKEALDSADEIAELTGRDKADIIEDLLDDGKLNQSNLQENTTAIEKATVAAKATHKLLTALIPILLLLATSGLELGGFIDLTPAGDGDDEWMWEEKYQEEYQEEEYYYGCTDYDALNYDEYANYDDGSCEYEEEEVECEPFFYDRYLEYQNNNTELKFEYDVDLDCEETEDVEVQFLAYENNSSGGEPVNFSIDYYSVYNGDIGYRNMTLGNFTESRYDIYAYLIDEDGEMITEVTWMGVYIEGEEDV
jgi:hypothetical protein